MKLELPENVPYCALHCSNCTATIALIQLNCYNWTATIALEQMHCIMLLKIKTQRRPDAAAAITNIVDCPQMNITGKTKQKLFIIILYLGDPL